MSEQPGTKELRLRLMHPLWVHSDAPFESPQLDKDETVSDLRAAAELIDWWEEQYRQQAVRIEELERSGVQSEPVAWRYKCHDGQIVFMETRLTDEQKARGYYRDEDDDDFDDDDGYGPFKWSDETPLYAASTLSSADRLCSCKASARDGQHMAWCPAISSTHRGSGE